MPHQDNHPHTHTVTNPGTVISSVVERYPKAEQWLRNEIRPWRVKSTIYGEVCVASEVFLRKVKFVYDKWSFTKGEVVVIKEYRHFDQEKRVEKSPKAKQGYALNELMQGIMNWLCHEFSLRSMNCPKGHCGGKSIYFFVYPCSYQLLGDLSTTLEMTVLGRVFLQG